MFKKFSDNPLGSRADLQQSVVDLFKPLKPYFSEGAARVRLGTTSAHFDDHAADLEGFARPLWGIIPLAAGGYDFSDWDLYRRGLINGTDPNHPEYWGMTKDSDQRLVEMAVLGLALSMLPEQVWQPLSPREQHNLETWLGTINIREMPENNWRWFRVMVNLGLKKVGASYSEDALEDALNLLDSYYLGDGWYSDGLKPQRDYYIAMAMHYYALIYAKIAGDDDPERAQRYGERAIEFAQDFVHWFAADGAALPYGRSLTYRFAQGAFWGALAFADVEALPWGVIKGLALRHLRWWSKQTIFTSDGVLTIGYAYGNLNMAEQYNSPGSPYWAMKYFLPLALPETHPFWQAEEQPLPELPETQQQIHPQMISIRDRASHHVVHLTGGQAAPWARHGGEKYAKFAYSTTFGFSVPTGTRGLHQAAADSMLALSDDGQFYRVREEALEAHFEGDSLYSRWQAMPDVEVETWLFAHAPWHLRVHHIHTKRPIWSAEGGFAVDRTGDDTIDKAGILDAGKGYAFVRFPAGASGLRDLFGTRQGEVIRVDPNSNLMVARTNLPALVAQLDVGSHWLACAVLADPDTDSWEQSWNNVPTLPQFILDKING